MEPMSPALAGRLFTIEPPEKQLQLCIRLFATTSNLGWTLTTRLITNRELVAATPSLDWPHLEARESTCHVGWCEGPWEWSLIRKDDFLWTQLGCLTLPMWLCYTGNSTGLGDGRPASHSDFLLLPLCSSFLPSFPFFPPPSSSFWQHSLPKAVASFLSYSSLKYL